MGRSVIDGTPCSSQLIHAEQRIADLEAQLQQMKLQNQTLVFEAGGYRNKADALEAQLAECQRERDAVFRDIEIQNQQMSELQVEMLEKGRMQGIEEVMRAAKSALAATKENDGE